MEDNHGGNGRYVAWRDKYMYVDVEVLNISAVKIYDKNTDFHIDIHNLVRPGTALPHVS